MLLAILNVSHNQTAHMLEFAWVLIVAKLFNIQWILDKETRQDSHKKYNRVFQFLVG